MYVDDGRRLGRARRATVATRWRPTRCVAAPIRRTDAEATAAAEFELGQYLHRAGDHAGAIPHWREAHRLVPAQLDLQAPGVELRGPVRQGHTDAYDSSWFEDIKEIGAENYYPPIVP